MRCPHCKHRLHLFRLLFQSNKKLLKVLLIVLAVLLFTPLLLLIVNLVANMRV